MLIIMTSPRCLGTNNDGNQCGNYAVPGREFCKFHGGHAPSGLAHPRVQQALAAGKVGGRFSKNMPTRMKQAYLEQLNDQDWLQLQDDNALLVARTLDLLGRTSIGESLALWQKLSNAYKAMTDASHDGQRSEAAKHLNELGSLINQGLADSYTWREISTTLEQRRKLVETQRRLDQDKGRNITAERALLWIGAIMQSLSSTLSDELDQQTANKILGAIGEDLNRLLGEEPATDRGYEGVVDRKGFPADT